MSYKITDENFSNQEFEQTDFGHIYYNCPKVTEFPTTLEELAQTLKHYNNKNLKVKIRNTGHSVNGQTLTDSVEVNISKLKKVHFDKEKMEVTVMAGNSWDELLKCIDFPNYAPRCFTQNPGQRIQVGGTVSVGGMGPYSTKNGGVWHHVKRIKLVTMTGEIIECSRKKNEDYFKYALSGYGRIGVTGEITLEVVKSTNSVFKVGLFYNTLKHLMQDMDFAVNLNRFDSIFTGTVLEIGIIPALFGPRHVLMLSEEVDESADAEKMARDLKKQFHEAFAVFFNRTRNPLTHSMSFAGHISSKESLVYVYPHEQMQLKPLAHPWSDYIVSKENYPYMLSEIVRTTRKYGLSNYIIKNNFLRNILDDPFIAAGVGRVIYKNEKELFPLTQYLTNVDDYFVVVSPMPNIPYELLKGSIEMVNYLTDLVYDMGGKRYLYGYHELSLAQVEKHYGVETIQKWNEIKSELDPRHLLNLDVIEHLDNY